MQIEDLTHTYSAGTPFQRSAVEGLSMTVGAGEFLGVIGHTGSGKSTLIQHLNGLLQPTSGRILLERKDIWADPKKIRDVRFKVGLVFQYPEYQLFEETVYKDIAFGPKNMGLDAEEIDRRVRDAAAFVGLHETLLGKSPFELSGGQKRRVAIAGVIAMEPKVLVLDEPTAALTDIEVEGLFKVMNKLTAEGKGIIFISHKMREVLHISDRVTILRAGRSICTLNRDETTGEELANLMIGRELAPSHYEKIEQPGEPVIALRNVDYCKASKHNGLDGVSLTVGRGEIVGIAGVDGNGQSQLAQIVTGVLVPEGGELDLKNKKIAVFSPEGFIEERVSHIPEDRNKMGLIGSMSISDNIVLKSTEKPEFSKKKGLLLKKKAIKGYAEEMREKYDIRCVSVEQEARNLSGGNQQKVILARELEGNPDLLVAVHPTRGLDIGATRFVHDSMIAARDRGCGVLLISADFDEILEVSDRIVVMFEGQVMGEYPGKNPPIQGISLAMAGK